MQDGNVKNLEQLKEAAILKETVNVSDVPKVVDVVTGSNSTISKLKNLPTSFKYHLESDNEKKNLPSSSSNE